MTNKLWTPSKKRINEANITKFIEDINHYHQLEIRNYNQLHKWSIDNISLFWDAIWQFVDIRSSQGYTKVVDDISQFPGTKWFVNSKLNFAENLLRFKDDKIALVLRNENYNRTTITYKELYDAVAKLSNSLRQLGVKSGDRVVAYLQNIPETIIAMLATTSIGAIWSSCGSELGSNAIVDRFNQIEPIVLFTSDGYQYKGKIFDQLPKIRQISTKIQSLKKIIVIPCLNNNLELKSIPNAVDYNDFINKSNSNLSFESLPFDHPVYIMFSSGTTGKPKCIVQSSGGILLNHLKEHFLHTNLKIGDSITYITTPSWMMWNWLTSALSLGVKIILYDGNPLYPNWKIMWQMIQDENVNVFGCSAPYLNSLIHMNVNPSVTFDLSSLHQISQTGSPLSTEGFNYVYTKIKQDIHLNSVSGGTEINGLFVAGTPIQSVHSGELQGPALGMKIKAYDEHGNSIVNKPGELICEIPIPSMPLYFWNDPNDKEYKKTYFTKYPKVWCHGDWIKISDYTGGITFFGRSDFILNPAGVRIGPAEIYVVIEQIKEISDSLVVSKNIKGNEQIILFVKLNSGLKLTNIIIKKIKQLLKEHASPRHVPYLILEVPDIPYTFNMKKVESAVSNIINGKPITNRDALINPKSLDFFQILSKTI